MTARPGRATWPPGPGNTIWFTEETGNRVGRVTGIELPGGGGGGGGGGGAGPTRRKPALKALQAVSEARASRQDDHDPLHAVRDRQRDALVRARRLGPQGRQSLREGQALQPRAQALHALRRGEAGAQLAGQAAGQRRIPFTRAQVKRRRVPADAARARRGRATCRSGVRARITSCRASRRARGRPRVQAAHEPAASRCPAPTEPDQPNPNPPGEPEIPDPHARAGAAPCPSAERLARRGRQLAGLALQRLEQRLVGLRERLDALVDELARRRCRRRRRRPRAARRSARGRPRRPGRPCAPRVAWSRAASIVASGMVLTVSGPISSST